jgi:autotransporter passenger strand-loop-strand repeat protein
METLSAGGNAGKILTSTLWDQSGTIYVNGTPLEGHNYNDDCPNASSSSSEKTLTGCTNTADSQILYYWLEQGKNLTFKVTSSNYFYLESDTPDESGSRKAYYLSDTASVGEGTLSNLNAALSSSNKLANGDFIAALNFYCGVYNHSTYGTGDGSSTGTSTSWWPGEYADGTNAAAFVAAGFDSYYFISRDANKTIWDNDGLSDVGFSLVRENMDYGEPIRVGVPGHAIYLDGYRKTASGYEYHLNFGWDGSSSTTWYTEADLSNAKNDENLTPPLYLTYIIMDLSPDITVNVTSAEGGYYGGSFLRGIERINHIVKDKSTTFSFDDSVHNSVIGMDSSAAITSKVDVAFQNINAAVITTASSLLSSARGMTFAFEDGAMGVNSSSANYVINETGNNALDISLNSSYLYSGYYSAGAEELNELLYRASGSGYSYGEFDDSFYSSIKGNAVKSGSAADIITLSSGSGIYGGLDLGGGSNVLNIENGSVFCGSFTGSADTLTVNMTVDSPDYSGPMVVVKDSSSFSSFYKATGGVLNVTLTDDVITMPKVYNLLYGPSSDVVKNFSVSLTAPGVSGVILDYENPESGNYILSYDGSNLGMLYLPGSVEKDLVNLYYGEYLINSGATMSGISVDSGLRLEVLAGGSADTISVNTSGLMEVYSGGYASGNTISVGGTMNVYDGAYVDGTEVSGSMNVKDSALAVNTTVSAGGTLNLSSGGLLTGSLKIADGGSVEASGGTILLDISSTDPESSSPIIENISLISGSPNFILNMADYQKQTEGDYILATGAAGLADPITVRAESHELGVLTVNSTLRSGGYSCSLNVLDDGSLGLSVAHADQTVMIEHSGSVSAAKNSTETLILKPDYSGIYNLYGRFDEELNGVVTLYNGKRKIATGTVKNGKMLFNKGKTVLLDSALEYTVVLKNTGKGGSDSNYSFTYTLQGVSIYWKGNHDDDTPDGQPAVTVTGAPQELTKGWVGFSDVVAYQKFELESAASLSLSILSNDKIKVTIYDQNLRSLQSISLKNSSGINLTGTTRNKLLDAGTYYLKVESTTASKGGRGADYSVSVGGNSIFFNKGDNSDDSRSSAADLGTVSASGVLVPAGWVGYGDTVDYMKINLAAAAKLSFTLKASDAVKFQIMNAAGKILQTAKVKANGAVNTKELLLDAGEYYLAVTSTNAKKGGYADYSLSVNDDSKFLPVANNSDDSWQAASSQSAKLPGDEISGWVGYGDPADFIKIELASAGQLSLDLDSATAMAYDAKEVKLSCLDQNGKSVALSQYDNDTLISENEISAGVCYLGVTSANVNKYDTSYSVKTGLLA